MSRFEKRPYKLYNKIQNYDWGTKDGDAFIPKFIEAEIKSGVPYAELWIGTHPKAPSEIEYEGKRITLNEIIQEYPSECLGNYVFKKFSGQFPFLLKVLSAGRALSIQTHPNKDQAKKLHSSDPVNYPDDNHKPEIAIALDSLTAIAGFRPVPEIKENLRTAKEINEFVGGQIIEKIVNSEDEKESAALIKELYGKIMIKAADKESLTECVSEVRGRLKNKKTLTAEEEQFLTQYELFGADVGLLSFFFFNIIQLKPGQAIFTDAGVPHAYIKGNIIECMANSDNVVRAGLTGKYKDVRTLLEIIKYDFKHYDIMNSGQTADDITYRTKADEFEISAYRKPAGFKASLHTENKPVVVLISDGNVEMKWSAEGKIYTEEYSKGDSFFIPAGLVEFEIYVINPAGYFIVRIP